MLLKYVETKESSKIPSHSELSLYCQWNKATIKTDEVFQKKTNSLIFFEFIENQEIALLRKRKKVIFSNCKGRLFFEQVFYNLRYAFC